MKGTMKALRMYAPYDFRIDEVAIPEIGDDDILIRVKGCGVCSGLSKHIMADSEYGEPALKQHTLKLHALAVMNSTV